MHAQQNNKLAILLVYASSQTFTSTVFAHVRAFGKYSEHSWFYLDYADLPSGDVDLACFDVVVIHYSVRLPFGQLCAKSVEKLNAFLGLKVLFIQDEYDFTDRAKAVMRQVGFQLVFTCVPQASIPLIYPPHEFSGVTFFNNLTGYVPDDFSQHSATYIPPSQRSCVVAYRGRSLPIRYGRLGQEKIQIGKQVQLYCHSKNIEHDIAWTEGARIYGDAWYQFLASNKAMLGSESGSNVFDWDGGLEDRILHHKKLKPKAGEQEIYDAVVAAQELDGVMNQISPRSFEMVAARTVMVLFEGNYSGVLMPYRHYIPLKKDFSNLDEVFSLLDDGERIDEMVSDAYEDLIGAGKYSYRTFVAMVDQRINDAFINSATIKAESNLDFYRKKLPKIAVLPLKANSPSATGSPLRANSPSLLPLGPQSNHDLINKSKLFLYRILLKVWIHVPQSVRPLIKKILGRG